MADIHHVGRGVKLTWLGHATFLIEGGGQRVLVDPWIHGNPACPERFKSVSDVNAILVTHGHFDHASEVPRVAREAGAERVVCCFETGEWLKRKGVETVVDMNKGGTVDCGGVKVTMTSADHSCGITDDDGSIIYGGAAAGFVIEMPGGLRIYHAGDTNVFGDMALIGRLYAPDIALLPIGGHYTMGPREAALAVELLGVKDIVPMHHSTFPVLAGRPEDLRRETSRLEGLRIHALEPGDTLD